MSKNSFKAFQVNIGDDLQDIVKQLTQQLEEEDYNPTDIIVLIGDKSSENIQEAKKLLTL